MILLKKKIDHFDWEQGLKEISKAVFKDDDFLYSLEDKRISPEYIDCFKLQ